jgi:SAM-dependent MidA family methyltransferase
MIPLALPEPDADARAHSERLRGHIAAEIRAVGGAIPFSRYMELALYAPGLGYYSAGATKFGAAGDFVTAPELGRLFAHCIGNAAAKVFAELGGEADLLELGGGSGAFAEAALDHLARIDALPRRYLILEPSADLRQRQAERLRQRLPSALADRVGWLDRPPESPWRGLLFANEVLDALPATRFALVGREVREEGVAVDDQGVLSRVLLPADALLEGAVRRLEQDRGAAFPDGYRSELLVQLPWWLQAVAGPLEAGLLLFVDYGYPRREYYLGDRRDGTLVCHYRHRAHNQPLHWPGLTDISAFVDFTAVAEGGAAAGFALAGYCSQASFLLGNGLEQELAAAAVDERAQRARNEEAKRLLLPGEMGERFKAIGLQRGIDMARLFAFHDLSDRL